jgi:hypothetical protein
MARRGRGDRGALRSNVIPHIGHIRLAKLTPQRVQTMVTAIQDKGLSARTAKYAHAVLRRALGQAERWGMITRSKRSSPWRSRSGCAAAKPSA